MSACIPIARRQWAKLESPHGRAAHVLTDRRFADPSRLADPPPAHPQPVRQTQRVTYFLIDTLSAGIGHPKLIALGAA